MTERIDRLTEPAVAGRFYLVPTVMASWPGFDPLRVWPVIGPKHADIEFLSFHKPHYHVDARFVAGRLFPRIERTDDYFHRPISSWEAPAVTWRRLKMKREWPRYPFGYQPSIQEIRWHFSGRQCKRGKGGWICPHRNVALGSIAPEADILCGEKPRAALVITCPLHGLRIDAESGIVLEGAHSENHHRVDKQSGAA